MRNLRDYLALLGPTCPPRRWSECQLWPASLDLFTRFSALLMFASSTSLDVAISKPRPVFISFFLCWFHSQRSNTTHDPKTSLDLQETADLALCLHPPKLKLMLVYLFEERTVGLYISAFNSISFNSPRSGYRDYWTPDLWNLKLRRVSQPI